MAKIRFRDIVQFPTAHYEINVGWDYLEEWLARQAEKVQGDQVAMDLSPDYQRVHVWTPEQQIAYVEFILRGGESGRILYWNHPGWMDHWRGTLELVDGKQRLEAVRAFLRNEVPVFGGHYFKDFSDTLHVIRADFRIRIAKLPTRREVLQWYLMINAGGTPHTAEELARVQELLAKEPPLKARKR
jgi:hypothetical protein